MEEKSIGLNNNHILELITANGIQRNLSILGGEPLDTYDKRDFIRLLIKIVNSHFPDIVICVWTGLHMIN